MRKTNIQKIEFESPVDLLEKLQEGIDSLDAGKGIPAGDVFAELDKLSKEHARQRGSKERLF